MNKIPTLALLLVAIGLGSLVVGLAYTASNITSYPNWSTQRQNPQGMMGNPANGEGMMGGGMMDNAISSIDNASFTRINVPPKGVTVDKARNTISVSSSGVTIPIEAAPIWFPPQPGEYWVIYGLVNPKILVKQGAQMNFLFINMDNETHMAAITTIAPPYQEMPMMQGSGMQNMMMSGMMSQGANSNVMNQVDAAWPTIGPMLPGVSATNGASSNPLYSDASLSITFDTTGSFWYLCLYPGHAQMGMYGEIQVVG